MKTTIPVEVELIDLPDGRRRGTVTVLVRADHAGVTPLLPFRTDEDGRPVFGDGAGTVLLDVLQAAVRGVSVPTIHPATDAPEEIVAKLLAHADQRPGLAREVGVLLLGGRPADRTRALTDLLSEATEDEVLTAFARAEAHRPGTGYDVGMALYRADAHKWFPGPDPHDIDPKRPDEGEVRVTGYDRGRPTDAVKGFVKVWGHGVADARAHLVTLDSGTAVVRSTWNENAPKTRANAEAEVARWATYGVTAEVHGFEEPEKTHRRSLRDLSRGPIG